jgi:GNAT superfamily N-acetyltransferase
MIRNAHPDDVELILDMGEAMHAESVYKVLTYNREKARKEVLWTIRNGFFKVVEINGALVGMMSGYVKAPYYSDDRVGFEELLYLAPDHRHGRHAVRLIDAWVMFCIAHGAVLLKPSTACGNFNGDSLYEAMGFQRVGSSFVKVVR